MMILPKSHFSSVRGLPTYLQYHLYIKSIVAVLVFQTKEENDEKKHKAFFS